MIVFICHIKKKVVFICHIKKNCADPDPDPAESSKATGPDRRRLLVYAAELCCHQTQFWGYVEILEKGAPEDAVSDFEPLGEGAWNRTILEAAGCMKSGKRRTRCAMTSGVRVETSN